MFVPAFSVTTPDHDVVPVVGVHVALSVLSSIVAIPTLSEAVPTTVTSADSRTVSLGGERIATWGGTSSSALRTTTDCVAVLTNPRESRICSVTP